MTIREAAQEIKRTVTMDDILPLYGYQTDRAGFMCCPFHSGDNTASLKVYKGSRGWSCFGCHAGGTAIDFVMKADGVSFADAVRDIDQSLNLHLLEVRTERSLQDFVHGINNRFKAAEVQAMIRDAWKDISHVYLLEMLTLDSQMADILRKPKQERTAREDMFLLQHRGDTIELNMEYLNAKERSEHYGLSTAGRVSPESHGEEPTDIGCDGSA